MRKLNRVCRKNMIVVCVTLVTLVALLAGTVAAGAVHVVRAGDNLSSIANAYGTTVTKLLALNDIANPNLLRVGQRLVVADDPQVHVVQRGETLSGIAARYGVQASQLAAWNGISDPNRIAPGQELMVSPQALHHRVARGENITTIARRYGVTATSIAALNDLEDPNRIAVGQVLSIPAIGGSAAPVIAATRTQLNQQTFAYWPVRGTLTSGFGPRGDRMHEGIDIAAPHGTPVRAAAAGRVSYADWAGSYGLLVMIDHGNGLETRYAHNSRITVSPGQVIRAGQQIALVGSTGRSTGPHVHFELRVNGEAINPMPWLPR